MGKGDKKTKRGKIWSGSFGKYRLRKANKGQGAAAEASKPAAEQES